MNDQSSYQQQILNYLPDANCMENRTIVITGATGGIGREISLATAQAGATVVLVGRNMQKLEALYDEIEQTHLPKPAIFPINFENAVAQDYVQLYDALKAEFGKIDALLNNAAALGPRTPIEQYSTEVWQTLMQINVTAPFLITKSLLPLLKKSNDASVLFTGSTVGYQGRAFWGGYAASKAAIENLMQTLADEYSDNIDIRFNSFNPGATRTAMRAEAYPAENPKDVISPEEHIAKYLFLLGPASRGITGQQFSSK